MRSVVEIRDRLWQEVQNLRLRMSPPHLALGIEAPVPLPGLPNPRTIAHYLRGSRFSEEISRLAERIRQHNFPVLGLAVATGPEICWRRDYSTGCETAAQYFRLIPYLNKARSGDHKVIWELNRHQHLVVLAQDYCLHGNCDSLTEIAAQLESWFAQNPFQRGINWVSALEIAFRVLSWTWVWHLAGSAFTQPLRRRLLEEIYLHGRYLEINLSFYFSPNTHLIGEAVALHALGALFPFPESQRWAETAARVVERQMQVQVREDGSHFEQSTYYHIYALDMFLFHAILSGVGHSYRRKLASMAEYLHALLGPAREIPFLGDDDGGRFFHPYGIHTQYGRATLATCAAFLGRTDWPAKGEDLAQQSTWWLGGAAANMLVPVARESRLFRDAGLAILTSEEIQVIVDVGPFGAGGGGHSHSDTLTVLARCGESEILVDTGTYTYVDPEQRDHFRGSGAHNTVRIDGLDQAEPAGPFRWLTHPEVKVLEWTPGSSTDILEAECRYKGLLHRRRVVFVKSGALFVIDSINGPEGSHDIEQFWHLGVSVDVERFCFSETARLVKTWRSTAFGTKTEGDALCVQFRTQLPCSIAAAIALRPGNVTVIKEDSTRFSFVWQPKGNPGGVWRSCTDTRAMPGPPGKTDSGK